MDGNQLIAELFKTLASLAWPVATVIIAYIAKLILDKIEIKEPDEKKPDVKPSDYRIPRVQVRPPIGTKPDATPPNR